MIRKKRAISVGLLITAWAFVLGIAVGPQPVRGLDLGDLGSLIKLFGIAWVVDRFANEINHGINTVLQQHEAEVEGATKVVPILRVAHGGGGTAVGAAQVMGPAIQVDKVQAVGELELNWQNFRGRAMLPLTTRKDLTSSIRGVDGVGVSANIKFPI